MSLFRQEFQTHVDDMQATIDNLQDILSNANLNVDPSMLYTVSNKLIMQAETSIADFQLF